MRVSVKCRECGGDFIFITGPSHTPIAVQPVLILYALVDDRLQLCPTHGEKFIRHVEVCPKATEFSETVRRMGYE